MRRNYAELLLENAKSPTRAGNSQELNATGDRDITLGPDPASAPSYATDNLINDFRGPPNGSNLHALRDETALIDTHIDEDINKTPGPERPTNGTDNLLNPDSTNTPITTLYHRNTPQGPPGP